MSHVGQLEEAFNRPYRYTLTSRQSNFYIGKFDLPDKGEINVFFEKYEWSDDEASWGIKFQRTNPKRPHASLDVTGEGDAQRIFATVIAIIKEFVKKEKPDELNFAAHKPDWMTELPHDHPKRSKELTSREKLYHRLVKRYAKGMGYKYTTQTDKSATDFRLVKEQLEEGLLDRKPKADPTVLRSLLDDDKWEDIASAGMEKMVVAKNNGLPLEGDKENIGVGYRDFRIFYPELESSILKPTQNRYKTTTIESGSNRIHVWSVKTNDKIYDTFKKRKAKFGNFVDGYFTYAYVEGSSTTHGFKNTRGITAIFHSPKKLSPRKVANTIAATGKGL